MVKLSAPKAVGLPKPPQIPLKVRDTIFVCQFWQDSHCLRVDRHECVRKHKMYLRCVFGLKPTNACHGVLWMVVECGRWGVVRNRSRNVRNEASSVTPIVPFGVLCHFVATLSRTLESCIEFWWTSFRYIIAAMWSQSVQSINTMHFVFFKAFVYNICSMRPLCLLNTMF